MKVLTIVEREWREGVKNRLLLVSVVLPALVFAIMPLAILPLASTDPMTPSELQVLYRMYPTLTGLSAVEATQLALLSQFMLLFLMIPAILPLIIASFSIIGEKQARSLEPLLATPVRVWELLVGKCVAAVIPAVLATWVGYVVCLVGVAIVGTPRAFDMVTNSLWMLSMLLLAPLLSVTATGMAIIVSSRVNDTRVAQQFSILLILPLMGLFVAQLAGKVLINIPTIMLASLVLLGINIALMSLAVRLFQRETILVNWS